MKQAEQAAAILAAADDAGLEPCADVMQSGTRVIEFAVADNGRATFTLNADGSSTLSHPYQLRPHGSDSCVWQNLGAVMERIKACE